MDGEERVSSTIIMVIIITVILINRQWDIIRPPPVTYYQPPPVTYYPAPAVTYYPAQPRYRGGSPQGLAGGVVGSVLGYEMGNGDPIATGLGAVAGSFIGNGMAR